MTTPTEIAALLESEGGTFVSAPDLLAAALERVRALVFDWDGVFNRGEKASGFSSGFSEADSMGVNMLRYGFWRRDGRLPVVAVISGERNAAAEQFARREHLHALYEAVRDKAHAMKELRERYSLQASEVACVFDDINDIGMARDCGVRLLIRRSASALTREYLIAGSVCDYVTACESGQYAVREIAELLLGIMGRFDEVVASRCAHDEAYRDYFQVRQAIEVEHRPSPRDS